MTVNRVFAWDCEHGCPPIHLDLPMDQHYCAAGHTHLATSERGTTLLRLAVVAHMKNVHMLDA